MTRVYLWLEKTRLGYLTETEVGYLWTPDLAGLASVDEYTRRAIFLPSREKVFSQMPDHFADFALTKRFDLIKKAGILPTDSPFTRLIKLAKLDWFENHPYPSLRDVYVPFEDR